MQFAREPEIGDLDMYTAGLVRVVRKDQDVATCKIAVDNAIAMQCNHAVANLRENSGFMAWRAPRTGAIFFNERVQGT